MTEDIDDFFCKRHYESIDIAFCQITLVLVLRFLLLGDIAEGEIAMLSIGIDNSIVCGLSVMFVHCAQTAKDIDNISSAYDSPVFLPDRVKMWLTKVKPFPHILPQSDPRLC